MLAYDSLYEVRDYNANSGLIELRLMFDPNGILLQKDNNNGRVLKNISGRWLEKHFCIVP